MASGRLKKKDKHVTVSTASQAIETSQLWNSFALSTSSMGLLRNMNAACIPVLEKHGNNCSILRVQSGRALESMYCNVALTGTTTSALIASLK